MEHDILLQKMEILSRKINKLKDVSTVGKASTSTSMYSKPASFTSWHGNGRLLNQPKANVISESTGFSKYRYTKKTPNVSSNSMTDHNLSPLPVPTAPKPSLPAPPNVYVNPHFKSRVISTPQETLKPEGLYPKDIQNPPCPPIVPKKTVYVNPTMFNSNKPLEPSVPLTQKNNTQVLIKTSDVKLNEDKKHFIHVNRTILSKKAAVATPKPDNPKTSIHVNPKVYARLKSEVRKETTVVRGTTTPMNKYRKIQEHSARMLVRPKKFSQQRTPTSQYTAVSKVRLLSASKMGSSPLFKVAKNVCSKYKYIRKNFASSNTPAGLAPMARKVSPFVKTKYKLDRRLHRTPKPYKNVQKYSLKYEKLQNKNFESNLQGMLRRKRYSQVNKSPFGNRVWGNLGSMQPKRVIITDRKLLRLGSSPVVKRSFKTLQTSTLLRIGGIFYKSSRTKLTRTTSATKPKSAAKPKMYNKSPISQKIRTRCGHIVNVRGNKFLMDSQGKTLKRVDSDSQLLRGKMKRVDIGGATFVQSSPNVLIRTNTHNVRNLLSQAKQKSIAVLATQRRKNNTICKFYRRFGRCFQNEKKRCPCVHDKKFVAVCKGFLKGKCEKDVCLLSHDLIPEKMPTCKYYLQACCSRDNCPYLHIKLNAQAPLCISFLQGYCSDGLACRKWHFNICPQFDKAESCPKGKYCPFPHEPRCKELSLDHMKMDFAHIKGMYEDYYNKLEEKPKQEAAFRYFLVSPDKVESNVLDVRENESSSAEESCSESIQSATENKSSDNRSGCDESCSDIEDEYRLLKRPKIGYLPPYIPLCRELMK